MTTSAASTPRSKELVDAYNTLVRQIIPVGVRLTSLHMTADGASTGSSEARMTEIQPRFVQRSGGFTAIQPFRLDGQAGDAKISLEFELAVDYDSAAEMTEEIFAVFGKVNLPLNAHPFVRETVASMTIRAGWPALILPAFVKREKPTSSPSEGPKEE